LLPKYDAHFLENKEITVLKPLPFDARKQLIIRIIY